MVLISQRPTSALGRTLFGPICKIPRRKLRHPDQAPLLASIICTPASRELRWKLRVESLGRSAESSEQEEVVWLQTDEISATARKVDTIPG
ncbi:hypothetical protein AVEN_137235-1 [Araneus ventricosus]|uniref:Uncharacterized protein n=1 Tax=Araneus ventricosus TaxID=182803 RepID=A0A4Y2IS75_ARAVE|nr:hypothetical protein AVEN_137235-1 [Araneus ventricosus]